MRIEVRNGEEYLIGAPEDTNDCCAILDGDPCCYHVDGQHVSVQWSATPGVERILARWPIVDAPAQPAPRILTPAEVRAAQAPRVAEEIERINERLVSGVRTFSVNAPLFDDIERALEAAGWSAVDAMTAADGRTMFVVREREEER